VEVWGGQTLTGFDAIKRGGPTAIASEKKKKQKQNGRGPHQVRKKKLFCKNSRDGLSSGGRGGMMKAKEKKRVLRKHDRGTKKKKKILGAENTKERYKGGGTEECGSGEKKKGL